MASLRFESWLARLRAAATTPPVAAPVQEAARRAASRATAASAGRFKFEVITTPRGARIVGYSLDRTGNVTAELGRRVLARALGPELEVARRELATQGAGRLR